MALLLLRDVAQLRADVDAMIRHGRRQADDIYAEQYNMLGSLALTLFPGTTALEEGLLKMPDAGTRYDPNAGTERLLARLRYLESTLSHLLGVDPSEIASRKAAADMNRLTQVKAQRFQFLRALWEETGGSRLREVNGDDLGQRLGFTTREADAITEYLVGEGLVENVALGGMIGITQRGVKEVERALSEPERPTEHFPPVNVTYIHQMVNSQFQQGTYRSTQHQSNADDLNDITPFLAKLRSEVPMLGLEPDDEAELSAAANTVEAQIASPRPKASIISESLETIREILNGVSGNLVSAYLVQAIPALQAALSATR